MAVVKDPPPVTLGALNAEATFTVEDAQLFSFQFNGTASMTVTFQYSNDGTIWVNGLVTPIESTTAITNFVLTGAHTRIVQSMATRSTTKLVRATVTAYTSGSTSVKFFATRYGA